MQACILAWPTIVARMSFTIHTIVCRAPVAVTSAASLQHLQHITRGYVCAHCVKTLPPEVERIILFMHAQHAPQLCV